MATTHALTKLVSHGYDGNAVERLCRFDRDFIGVGRGGGGV